MTGPRSHDEVHAEQVAHGQAAVQQAQAANDHDQQMAQHLLANGSALGRTPVTPPHTD